MQNGGSRKSINPYRTGIPKLGVATDFRGGHKLTKLYRKLCCLQIALNRHWYYNWIRNTCVIYVFGSRTERCQKHCSLLEHDIPSAHKHAYKEFDIQRTVLRDIFL